MKKIIEYGYVSDYDLERFWTNMNIKIREGYQPFGTPVYLIGCGSLDNKKISENRLFQAYVKYED